MALKSVLVTGVSTGIGRAIAGTLVGHGLRVFGSVRKEADGRSLFAELGDGFTPLLFDVTDEAAVAAAAREVRDRLSGQALWGLVNNAGIAVFGPLQHLPVAEFRRQLEVNLVGPLTVIQSFLPLLGADRGFAGKPGRIVNISSVGGKIASPFLGPYSASKFGLEGMSESLRRELLPYGIDVVVVGPGAVATPIWDKAERTDAGPYEQTDYAAYLRRFGEYFISEGRKGLPPERIGEAVWKALSAARPRVRYAVVPKPISGWALPLLLPKRLLDRVFAKGLGMTKRHGDSP